MLNKNLYTRHKTDMNKIIYMPNGRLYRLAKRILDAHNSTFAIIYISILYVTILHERSDVCGPTQEDETN